MVGRRVLGLVGAVALVVPLTGWNSMPAAAAGGSLAATSSAAAATSCFSTDNGDPVLKTLAIEPRAVDSRNGAKVVTFTATAEDTGGPGAASGVTDATAYVGLDDRGGWDQKADLAPDGKGALVGTLTVLPQSPAGTRYVSLTVRDADGNSTSYSAQDLEALGLPATFTTVTDPDTARPALKSLRLSTGAVDTRLRSRGVTVTVRATDDKAVAAVDVALFGLRGRTRTAELELVSGSPKDGTWRGRLVVPRWSGSSTAKLAVQVTDAVDRSRWFGPRQLARAGQPSRLVVVSRTDRVKPTVSIISVTPTSVDVTAAPQTIQVVARARDLDSGVRRVTAQLVGPESPEGQAFVNARLSRASGTSRNGIWTGTVTLGPCAAPAGEWRAIVRAKDAIRRSLAVRSGPLTVVNADVSRPTAQLAGDSWQVRPAGPLSVEFGEAVKGVVAANTLVHIGDDQRGRAGDGPAAIPGSWACKDAAGAVVDCAAGPVRTAAFTPSAPLSPATNHTLVLNPEHHLGLTDLAGNPYSPYAALGFRTG